MSFLGRTDGGLKVARDELAARCSKTHLAAMGRQDNMSEKTTPVPRSEVFRPLVAFDFDGTLTWRDSFRAFLAWRSGARRYATAVAALAPQIAAYAVRRDRTALKAAMVRVFLKGETRSELETQAQRFAAERSRLLLRPDAVRTWKRWQGDGARLIIVTATPQVIVAPFGRGLGAEKVIGSLLEFDAEDKVTGRFVGPNCRGQEKVVRLKAEFGEDVRLEAAYGDSDGDTQMLALADEAGLRVFGGKP